MLSRVMPDRDAGAFGIEDHNMLKMIQSSILTRMLEYATAGNYQRPRAAVPENKFDLID